MTGAYAGLGVGGLVRLECDFQRKVAGFSQR